MGHAGTRRLAAALALLLALSLSACGSGGSSGKLPGGAARPAEQAGGAVYDDSLITEACSIERTVHAADGTALRLSIHVPQLVSDAPAAQL